MCIRCFPMFPNHQTGVFIKSHPCLVGPELCHLLRGLVNFTADLGGPAIQLRPQLLCNFKMVIRWLLNGYVRGISWDFIAIKS